jgi:hypothetical protein
VVVGVDKVVVGVELLVVVGVVACEEGCEPAEVVFVEPPPERANATAAPSSTTEITSRAT